MKIKPSLLTTNVCGFKKKNRVFIYHTQKPEALGISNTNLSETESCFFWIKPTIVCLHIFFTASSYKAEKTFLVHKTHQVKEENVHSYTYQ